MSLLILILGLGLQVVPRGAPIQPVGTASIDGTVVRAGTIEGLAQAALTLIPESKGRKLTARADGKGGFHFEKVEPGRYRLIAEHEGYIRGEYGQRTALSPGTILVVQADRHFKELVLPLTRSPAIAGYISNPVGEPLAAASVQAYRIRYTPNGRKLTLVQTVLTNDFGEYRLYGLDPGSYYVSASYSDTAPRPALIRLTPNLAKPDDGYTTLFYPGAVNPNEATPIRVQGGIEANNMNIALKVMGRFTVSGKVTALRALSSIRLAFLSESTDPGDSMDYPIFAGRDGAFRIQNVLPGSYILHSFAIAPVEGGEQHFFSNAVRVYVENDDVSNVAVPVFPAASVSGRVSMDTRSTADDFAEMKITLQRSDGQLAPRPSGKTAAGGEFEIIDIPRSEYEVSVDPLPAGTYVAGIRVDGRDGLLNSVTIESTRAGVPVTVLSNNGDASTSRTTLVMKEVPLKMEVVLTSSGGSIEGMVTDLKGDPVSAAQVVLVPEARFRKRADRYLIGLTDESGHFEISGVTPLPYTAFAFEQIEAEIYFDSQFIRRFEDRGVAVGATKGSRRTIKLRLIPADETGGGGR